MNDLGRLLASMSRPEKMSEILPPSIQAKRLGEAYNRYINPCPFKPGDLVTPVSGSNMTDQGIPHIVLETCEPRHIWVATNTEDTTSMGFGRRIDMRVAVFHGGEADSFAGFWVESYLFEPWTGDIAA